MQQFYTIYWYWTHSSKLPFYRCAHSVTGRGQSFTGQKINSFSHKRTCVHTQAHAYTLTHSHIMISYQGIQKLCSARTVRVWYKHTLIRYPPPLHHGVEAHSIHRHTDTAIHTLVRRTYHNIPHHRNSRCAAWLLKTQTRPSNITRMQALHTFDMHTHNHVRPNWGFIVRVISGQFSTRDSPCNCYITPKIYMKCTIKGKKFRGRYCQFIIKKKNIYMSYQRVYMTNHTHFFFGKWR
jgi:hypothetical protein